MTTRPVLYKHELNSLLETALKMSSYDADPFSDLLSFTSNIKPDHSYGPNGTNFTFYSNIIQHWKY
jgi:hypothetical protein